MKSILFAVALFVAGVTFAGEPSTIVLKTKVHGLPPNTRITLEMRARYLLLDFSNVKAKRSTNSASVYMTKSPQLWRNSLRTATMLTQKS